MVNGSTIGSGEGAPNLDAIETLKRRYCRLLDARDWNRWEALFTEDARMQIGPSSQSVIRGRAAIRRLLARQLWGARTRHEAREPVVEEEEPGRYRVVWEMTDRVQTPLYVLEGSGFYEDRYVQTGAGLKIASIRLHRNRVELQPRSAWMRMILRLHRNGWLARLAPSADRTLREALHVGLKTGERP